MDERKRKTDENLYVIAEKCMNSNFSSYRYSASYDSDYDDAYREFEFPFPFASFDLDDDEVESYHHDVYSYLDAEVYVSRL